MMADSYVEENLPRYAEDDRLIEDGDPTALLAWLERSPEIQGTLKVILQKILVKLQNKTV